MKQFTLVILTFLSIQFSNAQINEFGLYLGGANFVGDVGATDYIAPNQLAIGAIYKWNRSPRHSYRVSLTFADLEGIDTNSDDPSREIRGFEFNNQIIELTAGVEFTFFDFNLHQGGFIYTPYLFSGISAIQHDNLYYDSLGDVQTEDSSSIAIGIPMVVGFKALVTTNIILAFEVGVRYTFSDNLDGSAPDSKELADRSFGNINNNDWYTFTGVTLTYTFGKNPCYCGY